MHYIVQKIYPIVYASKGKWFSIEIDHPRVVQNVISFKYEIDIFTIPRILFMYEHANHEYFNMLIYPGKENLLCVLDYSWKMLSLCQNSTLFR